MLVPSTATHFPSSKITYGTDITIGGLVVDQVAWLQRLRQGVRFWRSELGSRIAQLATNYATCLSGMRCLRQLFNLNEFIIAVLDRNTSVLLSPQ